jgi:RimJ/RimL family protein N-acetyltransferase
MRISRNVLLKEHKGWIVLRPPVIDDVRGCFEAVEVSKKELAPWMDWCFPDYSLEHTIDWITSLSQDWEAGRNFQFAIIDSTQQQFLGSCGINHINQYYLMANLGYWVRSDRTGEGIATTATKLLAKFGFKQLGLKRLEIVTGLENGASRRVAEKAGATFEGHLRKRLRLGGDNIDAAMHSLIAEDFP